MNLVKWSEDSLKPITQSIFDNLFNSAEGLYNAPLAHLPAVNVKDKEDSFEMELAAPGKNKDDFKIEILNRVLTISSEEESTSEESEDDYARKEYSYSSFKRSFTLPEHTNEKEISASYDNGILLIQIPKNPDTESMTQSIAVD